MDLCPGGHLRPSYGPKLNIGPITGGNGTKTSSKKQSSYYCVKHLFQSNRGHFGGLAQFMKKDRTHGVKNGA